MRSKKIFIAVGTKNTVKILPVKEVFSHHYSSIQVIGVDVQSGVGEQPMSDEEMFTGAYNRAKESLKKVPKADYGVGIEGGVQKHSYGWFEKTVVVIMNSEGKYGVGISGSLQLPEKISNQILNGKNLEQAVDSVFGTEQIGEGIGMFGIFTKELVTRSSGIKHGVAFAYARFLYNELYSDTK